MDERVVAERGRTRPRVEAPRAGVEAPDPGDAQVDTRLEEAGQRKVRALLPGGQLVEPRTSTNWSVGRREGQLHLVTVGLLGDPVDGREAGVPGSQHHHPVHVASSPFVSRFAEKTPATTGS
jgi:hypothetical protein